MNPNKKVAVSRSRRQLIDQLDGNNFAINKKTHFSDLIKSISDLEIMTDSEWLQYQKSLLVSFMADISSESSYKLRSSTKKDCEIIRDGDIEYFFSGELLTEEVETIYVKYQNRYFFLHDRKTVTPETIRLKTELRVKNDLIDHLRHQLQKITNQT